MALEQHLEELKKINGFQAAGIMGYTGELLASYSAVEGIDLAMVGATFNDIFRSAHEVCEKIGLEATKELVLITPKGIIIMLCTGVKAKIHVHFITILSSDGNQALAKMTMNRIADPVMNEIG